MSVTSVTKLARDRIHTIHKTQSTMPTQTEVCNSISDPYSHTTLTLHTTPDDPRPDPRVGRDLQPRWGEQWPMDYPHKPLHGLPVQPGGRNIPTLQLEGRSTIPLHSLPALLEGGRSSVVSFNQYDQMHTLLCLVLINASL